MNVIIKHISLSIATRQPFTILLQGIAANGRIKFEDATVATEIAVIKNPSLFYQLFLRRITVETANAVIALNANRANRPLYRHTNRKSLPVAMQGRRDSPKKM